MKYLARPEIIVLIAENYSKCKGCNSYREPLWHADEAKYFQLMDDYVIHWNLKHREELKTLDKLKVVDGSQFIRFKPPERHSKAVRNKSR